MAYLMHCVLFCLCLVLPLQQKGDALLEAARTNNSEDLARYMSVSHRKQNKLTCNHIICRYTQSNLFLHTPSVGLIRSCPCLVFIDLNNVIKFLAFKGLQSRLKRV